MAIAMIIGDNASLQVAVDDAVARARVLQLLEVRNTLYL
jgi:hypothetical protein